MGAISPSIFIFYCFAFLKTQASCFWFNFSEEESTMRFSCCFAQKYCPYLLSFFFWFSLLFPWCWMHVYKKKRHLWSMDSSGDVFNSVSFCQNLSLCFLKEVQLETLISVHSVQSSILPQKFLYVSSRNHSFKKKAEYVWKKSKKKRIWGGLDVRTHI